MEISNQMLCSIGESLVSAQLIAHGWPTANVNSSIQNFKGIDLFCQKGSSSPDVVGIQVKTTMKGGFLTGISCGVAADLEALNKKIIGPWVFVHILSLDPLSANYYVLTRAQVIDILYQSHQWYLYEWNRQSTDSLKKSPAAIEISWLKGNGDSSIKAQTPFINPYPNDMFLGEWENIWR